MKTFLTLLILISSFSLSAQTTETITGKWKFVSVYEPEKMEEQAIKMLESMFSGFTFDFKNDGSQIVELMGKSSKGNWKFNQKKNEIEMETENGEKSKLEIIEMKDNRLSVRLKSMAFIIEKI